MESNIRKLDKGIWTIRRREEVFFEKKQTPSHISFCGINVKERYKNLTYIKVLSEGFVRRKFNDIKAENPTQIWLG